MTLGNVFKFLVAKGLPQGTATDYMITSISIRRIILDLGFFISILLILNILKGNVLCSVRLYFSYFLWVYFVCNEQFLNHSDFFAPAK